MTRLPKGGYTTWPNTALRHVALLCLSAGSPVAHASVDIALKLETTWGQNSNLFKNNALGAANTLPSAPAPTNTQTQAHGATLAIGIPLDSTETRLVLTTSLTTLRWQSAAALNHTEHTHTARLPWRHGALWEGEWTAGRSQTAYPVDDFYAQFDPVERRWLTTQVILKPTPDIHLPLRFVSVSSAHGDRTLHANLDEDIQAMSASVLYRSPLGHTAEVGLGRKRLQNPFRISQISNRATEERESETFVDLQWVYSAKTQASLRWAKRLKTPLDGTFQPLDQHVLRLSASHALSPQLRLQGQAWRQPYQNTDAQANYGMSKGQGMALTWVPSYRWSVSAAWQRDQQQELTLGTVQQGLALNPTTHRTSVRTGYELTRGLTAYVSATHERRVRRGTDTAQQTVWQMGMEYRYENLPDAAARTAAAVTPTP